ncbi:WblI protein [[Clostridium] sordellii]|uniref:glycosyltransferase family 4 protein n=1 Tax=Paraclostridium sordellii TaxID=1505 RepID=UPI0005DF2053|nr:glycosyltransferase family 4 protein [Paeniclostridium sordellii]CEQ23927.1 WblI protein [[Clostridium] sordellii] [Paeniclostridium sordellii]
MSKNVWLWNHYATDMYTNEGGRHYWFAENLIKRGYKATIFCANTYHDKKEHVDTKGKKYITDTINNIPFVFIKTIPAFGNGFDRIKNMVFFYKNILSVAKKYAKLNNGPDIIIASSVHPLTMVAGIQIAKKLGVPCICEIRDLWPEAIFKFDKLRENSILGKILVAGEHWIYRNADSIIFTKEGDIDYIKEKKWDINQGGYIDLNKCHYINNGINLKDFIKRTKDNTIEDLDLETGKFNVIYAGAIRPVNNLENILDTAKLLNDYTDIQFLIYGDGNQREMLENRIIDESINNVKFKGYVNKTNIPYILSKSSVNILNYSNTQYNWSRGNSSNKLFEYMASGKPIISTVKMGYCILEKYQCGISLDESTPENLAKAILNVKKMSKNDYNKISKNAIEGAKDFDFNELTEKLIHVIDIISNSQLSKESVVLND